MSESRKASITSQSGSRKSSSSVTCHASAAGPPQGTEARKQKLQQQRSRRASRAFALAQSAVTRPARLKIVRSPSSYPRTARIQMQFPEPDLLTKTLKPIKRQHADQKLVFLAGGMTAPVSWRSEVFSYLTRTASQPNSGLVDVILINPWLEVEGISDQQLTNWETEHFKKSDMAIFWLHNYSPCMVSLLEFGTWALPQNKKPRRYQVIVGADPEYEKRATLVTRCKGHYKLHDSLASLMQATVAALRSL